jgi:hypothetical protein
MKITGRPGQIARALIYHADYGTTALAAVSTRTPGKKETRRDDERSAQSSRIARTQQEYDASY